MVQEHKNISGMKIIRIKSASGDDRVWTMKFDMIEYHRNYNLPSFCTDHICVWYIEGTIHKEIIF